MEYCARIKYCCAWSRSRLNLKKKRIDGEKGPKRRTGHRPHQPRRKEKARKEGYREGEVGVWEVWFDTGWEA